MLFTATAVAEPLPPPTRPLTLIDLTDLAMRNNPTTRVAWAEVRQSEAAEKIARAGYWPTLTVSYSLQRTQQLAFGGQEVAPQTRQGPSVSLTYLLFDFGTRAGTVDQAAADALATRLTRDTTLRDLSLSVESAYYSVIGSRAVEDASRRSVAEAQANDDAAQARHDAGLATVADVYQAQSALASARLALQQAEGARVIAEGALAVAAGYSPDASLSLAPWQAPPDKPETPAQPVTAMMQAARDARPDLLAAKAREQAAQAAVRAARGRNWPTLNLNANAARTTIEDRGTANQYSAQLRADWTVFSGFSVQGDIERAEAALDASNASIDSLRQSVEQQVWVSYQNVQTALKNLDASRAQLKSAELAAEAIRARYHTGLSSILEVLTTEASLAQARVAEIQAGINWYQALATLGHDVGGLAPSKENTK